MTSIATLGYGTTLKWNDKTVIRLTKIGKVTPKVAKLDATTFGSSDYYKEYLPGMIDPGEVSIEGLFRPDDTEGQKAMYDDMNSREVREFIITFPSTIAATTWTGNAYIMDFAPGDITPENLIKVSMTLFITGKPTLAVTLSADISDMTGIEENAGASLTFVPAFAAATYTYETTVNTASDWIKLTVTQATAASITATALGTSYTLTSGVQSSQIAIDNADSVTEVVISEYDTGKAAKTYKIYVARPSA